MIKPALERFFSWHNCGFSIELVTLLWSCGLNCSLQPQAPRLTALPFASNAVVSEQPEFRACGMPLISKTTWADHG